MVSTSKGGPPICDVARGIIRDLDSETISDDCTPDDVADAPLHRWLPGVTNIRGELTIKVRPQDVQCIKARCVRTLLATENLAESGDLDIWRRPTQARLES